MSVPEVSRRAGPFEGNGSAKEFAFHFKVFTGDQIAVYVSASDDSDVRLENGYSVELNEDQEVLPGGTVYLIEPLPEGRRLSVLSNVPYDQPMVLTNQGGFYPNTVNNGVDRLEIQIQQLLEKIGRALLVPVTSDVSAEEILRRLLETYELAQQVVAIADEIRALGPVADDIAALGPHAEAIQRISDRLEDLLQIDGIIGAIEEIEENTQIAQNAAETATNAADRVDGMLGDLEGVFEENRVLADLTDSYLFLLTSTAATTAAAFTKRDIEHYYRWEREGLALLEAVCTLALTRATETQNDIEHFEAWYRKQEEEETEALEKLSAAGESCVRATETFISVFDDDMRTRNLLIRTYVEKPPVLFIVAGQSNAVGFATDLYEKAHYAGQYWKWRDEENPSLQPLQDPTAYKQNGSAWPEFGRTFFELTGRKVCILNVAYGGASVVDRDAWNTWGEGGTHRATATGAYQACTAALGTKGEDWVEGGVLWIQGEAETNMLRDGTTTIEAFIQGTKNVFSFFRTLTSTPALPIYMSQIAQYRGAFSDPVWWQATLDVRDAQVQVANEMDGVYMAFEGAKYFEDAGYMSDNVHYSQKGYNILGKAFARCVANTQSF